MRWFALLLLAQSPPVWWQERAHTGLPPQRLAPAYNVRCRPPLLCVLDGGVTVVITMDAGTATVGGVVVPSGCDAGAWVRISAGLYAGQQTHAYIPSVSCGDAGPTTGTVYTAQPSYWLATDAGIPESVIMGEKASGIVINTTSTGVPTVYASTCPPGQVLTYDGGLACVGSITYALDAGIAVRLAADPVNCDPSTQLGLGINEWGSAACVNRIDVGVGWANDAGKASTASALAADPADCAGGQYATSIDASGALTCADLPVATDTWTCYVGNAVSNPDSPICYLRNMPFAGRAILDTFTPSVAGVGAGTVDYDVYNVDAGSGTGMQITMDCTTGPGGYEATVLDGGLAFWAGATLAMRRHGGSCTTYPLGNLIVQLRYP